jgi:hypothetical protein
MAILLRPFNILQKNQPNGQRASDAAVGASDGWMRSCARRARRTKRLAEQSLRGCVTTAVVLLVLEIGIFVCKQLRFSHPVALATR